MSLTSFLNNNSDVRERFKQEFYKPPLKVREDLLAMPLTKRYSTVGTAFDYILRFYIKYLNPNTIDKGYWIAETSLALIKNNPDFYTKGKKIVLQAREREKAFLETGQITDKLIESSLSLAYLDPIYRSGQGHEYIGTPIDEKDVEDIRNLISIVNPDLFKSSELCMINPTFGIASKMVRGADADIVIGDNIIDIKTTKKLELKQSYFQQIMGYYILHQIGGLEKIQPKPKIKKVSIYFSRYACLHTFDLESIINKETFPDFVAWFKQRAEQDYGKVLLKKNNRFSWAVSLLRKFRGA